MRSGFPELGWRQGSLLLTRISTGVLQTSQADAEAFWDSFPFKGLYASLVQIRNQLCSDMTRDLPFPQSYVF